MICANSVLAENDDHFDDDDDEDSDFACSCRYLKGRD